jgi:5-oxoprolinase (ATP-hydrolysing)
VQAAVIYVLRSPRRRADPLERRLPRAGAIAIPPGSLLDPAARVAVVGGNVETSQRVVDVLLGAIGRVAASQGTMNNVAFGDATFGYYETIGGGAGAGPGFDGASGVHTHMTNTRITDPEILESRHPVRLSRSRCGAARAARALPRRRRARAALPLPSHPSPRRCSPSGALRAVRTRGGSPGSRRSQRRAARATAASRSFRRVRSSRSLRATSS